MANTYQFLGPDNSCVARSGDGAAIPWGSVGPLDQDSYVWRIWVADGSPTPSAYVAPPPSSPTLTSPPIGISPAKLA